MQLANVGPDAGQKCLSQEKHLGLLYVDDQQASYSYVSFSRYLYYSVKRH